MVAVSDLSPRSPRAYAHLWALRCGAAVAAQVAKPPRYHGVGAAARSLGRLLRTNGAMVTISRDDGRYRIRLDDSYWARLLINGFRYEPEIAVLLDSNPTPFTFIDCGANIGYWSVHAARVVDPGRVVAIEASPHLAEILEAQAWMNGGFRCVHAAVWRETGTLRFESSAEVHASGSVSETGYEVPAVTLDDVAADLEPPFVVKLDVEGAELAALEGASRLLASTPLVIFEELGSDRGHLVVRFFLDRGARVRLLTEDGQIAVDDLGELERLKREREHGRDPAFVGHNLVAQ